MIPSERHSPAELLDEKSPVAASIDDDDEPTSEDLVEMLRESLEDVKAGRTRPVEELLRELAEIRAKHEAAS